ncbi:Hsp20/alpha crystallin family protein [Halomicrobium urmianum]|uniref:Hsp20/alpha crystallin family protein n=1 Tax=Halomicrobium urmianum TaxID=1586233 RepID=UPI001CD97AFF|nr:Hsp20/alpha crystallin family protein [Halomicrobium urmianum]
MSGRNDPFETIEQMFEQMSRQFGDAAETWGGGAGFGEMGLGKMGVDLADRGDEFVVTVDVPGFEEDEIDLRLTDDTLQIAATHERATEEREETYLRSERQHRSLRDRVQLPEPVAEDETEATLRNGVLTVRLPKAEPTEAGGRQIDID